MKLKLNIRNAFSRTGRCIIFILFVGMSFSLGDALANDCNGGPDCLNCPELTHSQVPDAETNMESHGCRPIEQGGTCDFEHRRSSYDFHGMVSAIRSSHTNYSGILTTNIDEYGPSHFSREFLSNLHSLDKGRIIPIYLRNHSLLC